MPCGNRHSTDIRPQTRHGLEIAEIADLEEAIAAAESAVETGRDKVRLEAGALDERKFNELAAPIEAKNDAPWRKSSMTRTAKPDATLSKPVDPKRDQAEETRRVLREMWDRANRAIDEQTGRSAPTK